MRFDGSRLVLGTVVLGMSLGAPGCRDGDGRFAPPTVGASSTAVAASSRVAPQPAPKLSVEERLKASQKVLQSAALTEAPSQPGVDLVTRSGRKALSELDDALRTFISTTLAAAPSSEVDERDFIERRLRELGIQIIGDDPEPLAEGRVGVKLRAEGSLRIATTAVRISNGASARLLIFDRATSITRTEVDVFGEAIRGRRELRRPCGGRQNRAITRSRNAVSAPVSGDGRATASAACRGGRSRRGRHSQAGGGSTRTRPMTRSW
jgi:hypothetical protein